LPLSSTITLDLALAQLDRWIDPGAVAGAAVAVRAHGELIAEHYAGEAQPGIAVHRDTLFGLASVSKPITATVVMTLVDDGQISLEEPIVRFVPEFAAAAPDGNPQWEAARRLITVRQALAHLTGLPEDLPPGTLRARDLPSLDTITDHLIAQPLQFACGTEMRYSNAGYALLGRLVHRVTGRDIWDYAQERLFEPMGIEGIVARPDSALDPRIATVADAGGAGSDHESYNSRYWRGLAIPWGGLFGTAAGIAQFAEQFMAGDRLPLSKRARQLMTTDQADGVSGGLTSLKLVWRPAHWGLGWEIKGSKRRHWTGEYTSPQTYCHWGAAGTLVWTDPTLDLTVAVFGNRTTFNQWPFQPVARWARLSNAIIASQSRE
jgi:CubicO group peptidase (beta-lactamase class C family)